MLNSYKNFEKSMDQVMKLRSRNYVNTDCNISLLVNLAYNDICTEVMLAWNVFEFQIDMSQNITYVLPKTNNDTDPVKSTEKYVDIVDIADIDGNDLHHLFDISSDQYTIDIKPGIGYENLYNGQTIRVLRSVIPDIEFLPTYMYNIIFTAMMEGMMFYIQDSVPSETDGKLGNLQYQRFFNAKKAIKARLPERERIVTNRSGNNEPTLGFEA